MAKINWYDPKDTWKNRRERSLVARGRAPAPVERPRPERVEQPRVVYQGWDMYGAPIAQGVSPTTRWVQYSGGTWGGGISLNSFVEKYSPVLPQPTFNPGDLVELIKPLPTYPSQFNHWNDNSFVVTESKWGWDDFWVGFEGEVVTVSQRALQLKDGPW